MSEYKTPDDTEAPAGLTKREEAFCQHYAHLTGSVINGSECARKAGYSERTANKIAEELLRKPKIVARISALKAEQFRRLHMDSDEALARVAEMFRASFEDVAHITPGGDPYIDMRKATPGFLRAVQSMKIEDFTDSRERDENGEVVAREVRRVEVKLVDRLKAAELLMKHLGLLKEKLEITVDDSFAEMLMKASKGRGD